ncbi:hypothetical protein GCM10020219_021430 [Nonomuraea dietziae]
MVTVQARGWEVVVHAPVATRAAGSLPRTDTPRKSTVTLRSNGRCRSGSSRIRRLAAQMPSSMPGTTTTVAIGVSIGHDAMPSTRCAPNVSAMVSASMNGLPAAAASRATMPCQEIRRVAGRSVSALVHHSVESLARTSGVSASSVSP